jgi:hypothetical protein
MTRRAPNGYLAIRDEAKAIGLPKSFVTDLTVHDRRWIEANITAPFVWIPRDCGTFICRITRDPIDGAGNHAWDAPGWHAREGGARFYTWDGRELREYRDARECSAAIREIAEKVERGG